MALAWRTIFVRLRVACETLVAFCASRSYIAREKWGNLPGSEIFTTPIQAFSFVCFVG
jgi:hypothetical protein